MLLRFHWMPTGNRCTLHRPMSSIFQDVLYLVLLLHFFACRYVRDWIELIALFAVWNEWNITAIRLIRFSYFALNFSTGCRFQLQCPYNSFVKNRRRFLVVVAILHKRCEEESANATHTAIKLTTFVNYRGNYTHVNVWISQTLGNSMRYSQCFFLFFFFGCFEIAKRIKDQFQWNMISAASMKPCTVLHCIPLSVKFIVIADKTSLHQSLWTWKIEDVTRLYYVICVAIM